MRENLGVVPPIQDTSMCSLSVLLLHLLLCFIALDATAGWLLCMGSCSCNNTACCPWGINIRVGVVRPAQCTMQLAIHTYSKHTHCSAGVCAQDAVFRRMRRCSNICFNQWSLIMHSHMLCCGWSVHARTTCQTWWTIWHLIHIGYMQKYSVHMH